jgi:hypothetical protein
MAPVEEHVGAIGAATGETAGPPAATPPPAQSETVSTVGAASSATDVHSGVTAAPPPPEPKETPFARQGIACAKQAMTELLAGPLAQAWPAARSMGTLNPELASKDHYVRETIVVSDESVSRETLVDGKPTVPQPDWAIVEDCAAPRGVVVHIAVKGFAGEEVAQLAAFGDRRGALERELKGVAAAYVNDQGGSPYATTLVSDLILGLGLQLLELPKTRGPLKDEEKKGLAYAAGVVRGYRCFLPIIRRQIDRAKLAAKRDITDAGFAMEVHARRKPDDYERVMGQIEARCRDELRRFLEHVQRELRRGLARALEAVEAYVRDASVKQLLESVQRDHKRNGEKKEEAVELMQVRPGFLTVVLTKPTAIIQALEVLTTKDGGEQTVESGLTAEIAKAARSFRDERLMEVIHGILQGTSLTRDVGLEAAWSRIEGEKFHAPMPPEATKQVLENTLGTFPKKASEEMPENEVPAPFAISQLGAQLMLPMRRFQQRYSGLLALLMLGGVGITALLKGLFELALLKHWGWALLLALVFVFLMAIAARYLSGRMRQEELFKATIAAREAVVKTYSRAQDEFAAEWMRAFTTNATNELEDLLRRVRTDVETPWARMVTAWENERALIERRRRTFEEHAKGLEKLPKQVADVERQLGKLSDELARELMKPTASS